MATWPTAAWIQYGLVLLYVTTSIPFFIDMRAIPRTNTCGMTYSAPIYKTLPFQTVDSRMAHTYAKYTFAQLFMDGNARHHEKQSQPLSGMPMLFVPGHLGSYKQARSLGQHLAELDADIDLFLLDFNEEATGMAGQFVLEQGFFLNEAVKEILVMYKDLPAGRRPTSVVVVGHSMGGIVARAALTLPNYKPQSILTIVTLSTPHVAPPFNLDASMTDVYATVNSRFCPSANGTTSATCRNHAVVLVSLAGGLKDFVVHSSLATIAHAVPPTNGFAALTSRLPAVGASMDHLCILWCHQFMQALSTALVQLIDPTTHQLRASAAARLAILRDSLLGQDSAVLDHHSHVARGFTNEEVVATGGVLSFELPLYIFRTQYLVPFPLLALVALAMLATQVERWQLDPEAANASFLSQLSPAAHWSSLVGHTLHQAHLAHQPKFVQAAAVGAIAVAVGASLYALDRLHSAYIVVLCYLYLIGFLHIVAVLLAAISRVPSLPPRLLSVFSSRVALAALASLVVAGGHAGLQVGWDPTRELALVVVALLAVHVVLVLSVLVVPTAARSPQHVTYQRTLFAFYFGVSPCWIGDLVYFVDVVKYPRPLDFAFVWHVARSIALLVPCLTHVFLARQWTFPLPPDAVFARLQGVRPRPSGSATAVVTADQCPDCFVEDGGDGAIFEEVDTPDTIHLAGNVTVGPTFRVVACDCGLRNLPSRDFCAFCKRLCLTCGGGVGARRQAHAFRDYMAAVQDQVAAHQGIPIFLWLVLVVGFSLVAQTPHVLLYVGTAVATVFSLYHAGLRGPLDGLNAATAASSTPWMEEARH